MSIKSLKAILGVLLFSLTSLFVYSQEVKKTSPKLVVSSEDAQRIKQMDEAIEKALPLREFGKQIENLFSEYDKECDKISKDVAITEDILSKYRPMIEQILKHLSITAEREKSTRMGTKTAEMVARQRLKLNEILKRIEEILKSTGNDFEQISRSKIEQVLNEISELTKDNPENGAPSQEDNDENVAKALSVIKDIYAEVDKNILKDIYLLNFIDRKRAERRKLSWAKTMKSLNEFIDKIKATTNESDLKLEPLTSENVEHLKARVQEKAIGLRQKIARTVWQYADKAYADKEYDDAKDFWEDTRKMYSDIILDVSKFQERLSVKSQKLEAMQKNSRKEVEIIISLEEKCEKAIAASEFREQIALDTVDPGRSLRLTNIAVNMAQAEILIKNQEYMNARDALEAILVKDPYNIKAMRMLKNLYEKIYASASTRRYNEYLETMVVNEWNWSEAVLPKPADKPSGTLVTKQTDKSSIASKLSDIFIPRIEFDNTSLNSVVQYLITESKENDTSIEKTGVPIMLQLNTDQIAQIPTITISLDDMPIGEIIRYICQSTGLKYRVEDRAVIISTDITAVMETKFFKVRANIINSIAPATTEDTMTMKADEDMIDLAQTFEEGGASTTKPSSVSTEQLKAYFSERGVPFTDTDATIAYDRRSGKLIVKNTPENLRRIESLLREIDIETPLVLIETKFVELTQTNLEELGFEYLFSKDINNAAGLNDTSSWQVTQNASTMRTLGTNASGIGSPVSTLVNDRLINNLQLPGFNAGNRFNLSFYLHALSRSQYAEVLSSPKVIATSGTEAVIRMVREEYYPDSWVGPEITITGDIITVTPAYPEFGESTDVGIRLRVTPTVSPNNYTISLVLHPEVIQRTGWTDYSYIIVIGDNETTGTLIMRELSTRDVMTNVKVFDGETLIIGGMIRDNVSAVDDRIPGFGDIPLLGRLARTTNELGTKSNLIVFVTARLISPDGIPIRTAGHTKGLFDFRR